MNKHVVIQDPLGKYWPGAIIDQNTAALIANRTEKPAVTLPVDDALLRKGGIGGYAIRHWGAGWPLGTLVPTQAAPLAVFVPETHQKLVWVAHVVPDATAPKPDAYRGFVRIVPDTTAPYGVASAITPLDGGEAPHIEDAPRYGDGWLLRGCSRANMRNDGVQGIAFYGLAPGLAVAWAAVSTAKLG